MRRSISFILRGVVMRNVSEYMLVLAVCLVLLFGLFLCQLLNTLSLLVLIVFFYQSVFLEFIQFWADRLKKKLLGFLKQIFTVRVFFLLTSQNHLCTLIYWCQKPHHLLLQ